MRSVDLSMRMCGTIGSGLMVVSSVTVVTVVTVRIIVPSAKKPLAALPHTHRLVYARDWYGWHGKSGGCGMTMAT
jgi:hypothetical protein